MNTKATYCPKCKHRIPQGENRCVHCGGPSVGAMHLSGKPAAVSGDVADKHSDSLPVTLAVGALFVVLIAVLLTRLGPLMNWGATGEAATIAVEAVSDSVQESDTLPDSIDIPHDKGMITITNMDDPRSGLHSNRGYLKPIGALKKGMTPTQVEEQWGVPLKEERIHMDEKSLERWTLEELVEKDAEHLRGGIVLRKIYGDPLYGIYITGRYADFKDGRLVNFYIDTEMERLYRKAIEARIALARF